MNRLLNQLEYVEKGESDFISLDLIQRSRQAFYKHEAYQTHILTNNQKLEKISALPSSCTCKIYRHYA